MREAGIEREGGREEGRRDKQKPPQSVRVCAMWLHEFGINAFFIAGHEMKYNLFIYLNDTHNTNT